MHLTKSIAPSPQIFYGLLQDPKILPSFQAVPPPRSSGRSHIQTGSPLSHQHSTTLLTVILALPLCYPFFLGNFQPSSHVLSSDNQVPAAQPLAGPFVAFVLLPEQRCSRLAASGTVSSLLSSRAHVVRLCALIYRYQNILWIYTASLDHQGHRRIPQVEETHPKSKSKTAELEGNASTSRPKNKHPEMGCAGFELYSLQYIIYSV